MVSIVTQPNTELSVLLSKALWWLSHSEPADRRKRCMIEYFEGRL